MSRSRKRSPFCGNTKAYSEKQDKQLSNRRLRRKVHMGAWNLRLRDVSATWAFAKDGRHRFDANARPDLMRK